MASGPITSWQIEREKVEVVADFLFSGSKITVDGDCSREIRRQLLLGRIAVTNLDNMLKSRDITLLTKVCIVKTLVFPPVTYFCETWTIKKAEHQRTELCCWRRLLRVPWTKETKPDNLKGNQPWILIKRTNAEAEAPAFWSSDVNNWLIGKDLGAGKDWGQKEKRVSEDEMAGWHHRCNGHELGWTLGDGEGQGGLACCQGVHGFAKSQTQMGNWATTFPFRASLGAQTVKNMPAMQKTQVQSLSWEDPSEKGMAIHSSILAWKIPWTDELSWLQSMGSQRAGHDWVTNTSLLPSFLPPSFSPFPPNFPPPFFF